MEGLADSTLRSGQCTPHTPTIVDGGGNAAVGSIDVFSKLKPITVGSYELSSPSTSAGCAVPQHLSSERVCCVACTPRLTFLACFVSYATLHVVLDVDA